MTGHIFIEGDIGTDVTAKTVRDDIANYPQADSFIVHINSGGGSVYEGYQIGSILKNIGKPTVAHIGSLCASIATYAALSCDSVIMSPHGNFMIHMPTGNGISGTSDDLRQAAAQLDRIKSEIIDRYYPKVSAKGVTREQLAAMMEKETHLSPQQALEMGFIDNVQEKLKAAARFDTKQFDMGSLTKEEAKGMFGELLTNLKAWGASMIKFNSTATLTLDDGKIVLVMTEDADDLVDKQISYEDGAPLQAGQYPTQDGQVLTVDSQSKITEAGTMTNQSEEVAKLKEENAALKQQIEASAKTSQENVQKEVEKVTASMTAQFTNLQKQMDEFKAKTFGDPSPVITEQDNGKGQDFRNEKQHDPMSKLWDVFKDRYHYNA